MKLLLNARIIFTLSLLWYSASAIAQEYQWAFRVANSAYSGNIVKHTSDNNLLLCGNYHNTSHFNPKGSGGTLNGNGIFIVKYSENGDFRWVKGITGINAGVYVTAMDIDAAGNIIITGSMSTTADFDPSLSGTATIYDGSGVDAFIAKYDSAGNYQWAYAFNGPGAMLVYAMAVDESKSFYISGFFIDTMDFDHSAGVARLKAGNSDLFISKYDSNGNYVWAKQLQTVPGGSTMNPQPNSLRVSGNQVYLAGAIHNTTDFDPSAATATKTAAQFSSFLAKYDTSGNYSWAHVFPKSAHNNGGGAHLAIDGQENVIFSMVFTTTVDFDPSSNVSDLTSKGQGDMALVKFNQAGDFIWAKSISGERQEWPKYLSIGNNDNIYVAGTFSSAKTDFDPSADSFFLAAYNFADDMFLAKYDSSGAFKWARGMWGKNYELSSSIALNSNEDVFMTGYIGDTTDFNCGTGKAEIIPHFGTPNVFLAKYSDCPPQVIAKTDSICQGEQYAFGSKILTTAGAYTHKFITVNGCDSVVNLTLKVLSLPNVVVTATDDTLCLGDSVTLTASGAASYTWDNGVTNGVRFAPASTLNYRVRGISASGCRKDVYQQVVVNPVPSATVSVTDNSKCSGTCNGRAEVNASGGTLPYSYAWDANAGNQTTAISTNLCAGNYTVTVNDKNGCQAISKAVVKAISNSDAQVYLTNLAAVDQANVSPAFSAYYSYNLPTVVTPPASNPRNFVDPGKKARFKVECTNNKSDGQSIVSGISKVRSNSPYITITDTTSALNNVGWNNKAWSADEFEIDINASTPAGTNAYIDFVVQENGKEYATTCIAIPVHPLKYSPTTPATVDDDNNPDSRGNDNDICDPNEIVEFYPLLDNASTLDAEYVRGRFENLDNHGFINIWDSVPGVNTTVYDATWWNYAFAEPQTITASSVNTTPEYDFVFDYTSTSAPNFKLYLVMAGGFKLFSGNALSLVQWSLPYTFSTTGASTVINGVEASHMQVYPNPTSGTVIIKSNGTGNAYTVLSATGQAVLSGRLTGEYTQVDISALAEGVYLVKLNGDSTQYVKIIKR